MRRPTDVGVHRILLTKGHGACGLPPTPALIRWASEPSDAIP